MNQEQYQRYVAAFNARDYDTLHGFFADDVTLQVNGYEIKGTAGIRRFYDFFHSYVRETVTLQRFISGDGIDFADVVIRFEGLKDLSAERLREEGYGRLSAVPAGGRVEIEFFICYESIGDKVKTIRCGIFQPPAEPRSPLP